MRDHHDRLARRAYAALGARYPVVVVGVGIAVSVVVAVVSVGVIATFYRPPLADAALVALIAAALTIASVTAAGWRGRGDRAVLTAWKELEHPTPRETVAAWEVATTLTLNQYRHTSGWVNLASIVPAAGSAAWLWNLGWPGFGAVLLAGLIPGLYATVLSYSVGERLVRPVVEEVAAHLPDRFEMTPLGLPLAKRLFLAVPAYTTTSAVLVGGLVGLGLDSSTNDASARLALTVGLSLGVGLLMSMELASLLSESIVRPLRDVRAQLSRIREEDFTARAPVLSGDEFGELAHDFNRMASGLQEREDLREHFGTYVDREIVRLIVAGQMPKEGFEVEVSILFVDVRGFTAFAESAPAAEVVQTLNDLFTEMVPIIEAFGGHVDKFIGDGMMAVFGAPEVQPDHADRAVDAARMIVDTIGLGSSGLRVAAGVNSGRVVAGPIGGAGRLNFSVIGDVVNTAARVEAATRDTGDDLLLTAATRDLLTRPQALVSRGQIPLKGKLLPVEVLAPAPPDDTHAGSAVEPEATDSAAEPHPVPGPQ